MSDNTGVVDSGAAAGGSAEPNCCTKCCDSFKSMDPERLAFVLKVVNVINSILLLFTGIWVFFDPSTNFNFFLIVATIYVIIFSGILLFWELRLEMCNICFMKNMGFMFSWTGRLLFFVFVGTLAAGLGLAGMIIGIFTFIVAVFNASIVCIHPTYFENLKLANEKALKEAIVAQAAKISVDNAANLQQSAQQIIQQQNEMEQGRAATGAGGGGNVEMKHQETKVSSGGALPPGWEERKDEGSGESYFVNPTTGEHRWQRPT